MLDTLVKDLCVFLSDNKLNVNIPTRNDKGLSIENSDNAKYEFYMSNNQNIEISSNIIKDELHSEDLMYIVNEIPQVNDSFITIYNCNTSDIRNAFNDRSITMIFTINIIVIRNDIMHNNGITTIDFINLNFDITKYETRINWLYLGKYLTSNKYSSTSIVTVVRKPKSCIFILILLFMCGDTGASINPGPTSPINDCVDDVINYDRYLGDIDPDSNYFNDTELNSLNFKSYTIDELNDKLSKTPNMFNIMHHNCRSILSKGKLDEYDCFIDMLGNPFDIIGLTETWLNVDNANSPIFKDYNYNHVFETRPLDRDSETKNRGGGLSLFIRSSIPFKKRNDLSVVTPYLELLFVEITLNNKTYLIGVTYRIPNTNITLFTDGINAILEKIKSSYELILMGDFNICLLHTDNHSNAFRNIMQSNSLFPTILEPTRVATVTKEGQSVVTESLIDNFFVNESLTYNSGLIYSEISDHYPIFISIPCNSNTVHTEVLESKYRLIDDFRIRKFKSAISNNSVIQAIMHNKSAEVAFSSFFNTFNQLYDKYFPIVTKKVTKKNILKPWITSKMIENIKRKHNLAGLAKKGKIDKKTYTDFKNELTKELRQAKANYYEGQFSKSIGDVKGTWKIINKNIKNQASSKKLIIKENGVILDQKDIPSRFMNYFANIPFETIRKINPVNVNALSYLKNSPPNTFFMTPIINKDIESAISSLKNCNGVHSISTLVLKESMSVLSEPLSFVLNLCIKQGYFPSELKTGCITPIFKKGNKYSIDNYRPVCSLSQFSKIFEKIIYKHMMKFIQENKIITSSQYGFQSNKSTESALIDFIEFIHEGLTKKSHVGAVFMDLSKAFDVMNHNLLKRKLEHYGFRGTFLSLLMNFLKDRKYFVCANGYKSGVKIGNIGVPQGSTLGPLLFLLFINDIENCSMLLKFILFADDTTVLFKSRDINQLNSTLSNEINKVLTWFASNKLAINLSKTNSMLFSNKRGNPKLNISLQDVVLKEKEVVTFLGVEVDRKLCWKNHINLVCNKISKTIAILRILKFSFPRHILIMVYMSLIYSYINYCNIIWGSADECHLKPLIVLQKKALRIITNSNFRDASAPIFYNLKLLPIHEIFHLNCLKFLYKCLNDNKFPITKQRILQNNSSHGYETRHKYLLKPLFERLELCKKAFLSQSIKLWNNLNTSIKDSKALHIFKFKVKDLLLERIKPT